MCSAVWLTSCILRPVHTYKSLSRICVIAEKFFRLCVVFVYADLSAPQSSLNQLMRNNSNFSGKLFDLIQ